MEFSEVSAASSNEWLEFNEVRLPTMERMLILSWLLKDFGWMTTNIYLGFSFGVIAVILHIAMIFIDNPRRPAFKYYNFSLVFWVIGNFIWMTLEFVCTRPSSDVHWGPPVPLGGINNKWYNYLVQFKTFLFACGASIQVYMYVGIVRGTLEIPTEQDENPYSQNEANLIFCRRRYEQIDSNSTSGGRGQSDRFAINIGSSNSSNSSTSNGTGFGGSSYLDDSNSLLRSEMDSSGHSSSDVSVSLAFLENAYIILWISKDLFWSWGTGDLYSDHSFAVTCESFGIVFGSLGVFVYIINSYVHRLDPLRLLDCLTTIFWILANYLWMSGEYFIRYHNLDYDDTNPGHDDATRIASACCFVIGIMLQISSIFYISCKYGCSSLALLCGRTFCRSRGRFQDKKSVELSTFSPNLFLDKTLAINPMIHEAVGSISNISFGGNNNIDANNNENSNVININDNSSSRSNSISSSNSYDNLVAKGDSKNFGNSESNNKSSSNNDKLSDINSKSSSSGSTRPNRRTSQSNASFISNYKGT